MNLRCSPRAFSLPELLVAMAITLILAAIVLEMINLSSRQWKGTNEQVRAFQSARVAFDTIRQTLSQATLAIEYDYYDANRRSRQEVLSGSNGAQSVATFVPTQYGRFSWLHFISGPGLVERQHTHGLFFQALLSFEAPSAPAPPGRLNAVGFFIRYGDDAPTLPKAHPGLTFPERERFRLFMYQQPTSLLDVYRTPSGTAWFSDDLNAGDDPSAPGAPPRHLRLLAENIIALCLLPLDPDRDAPPLAPDYRYDTRMPWSNGPQPVGMHQLPPVVRVIMVAIEEEASARDPALGQALASLFATNHLFETASNLAPSDGHPGDLALLEEALTQRRIAYRVFQADVPIHSAKWSRQ